MIIRKALISDLHQIMKVYQSCVAGMIKLGIDQWDSTYPNISIIRNDILEENFYVGIIKDEIVAGIKIDQKQDPTYLTINWKDKSNKFIVVHRLCSSPSVWSKGVGSQMMIFAEKLAANMNCSSIRLDTYINNPKAIMFYEKLQYKKLGSINLKPNKDVYYCFEKII